MGMTPPSQPPELENNPELEAEKGEKYWYYGGFGGATSFAQLEAYQQSLELSEQIKSVTYQFVALAQNILSGMDGNKSVELSSLADEYKARLTNTLDGNPPPDLEMDDEGKAKKKPPANNDGDAYLDEEQPVAGTLPKKKKKKPATASKTIAQILQEKYGPRKSKQPEGTVTVFKEKSTGALRWVAVWSNNIIDRDNPPDIISKSAHIDYVKAVNSGECPFPELWHWHIKGTAFGDADSIAFVPLDKNPDVGFMVASGTIRKGQEKEAMSILGQDIPIGVSHGFKNIKRDPHDPKVIRKYRTYEISVLPLEYAANELTTFKTPVKKGRTVMAKLPKMQKDHLRSVGWTKEAIAELEADIERKGVAALKRGAAFKGVDPDEDDDDLEEEDTDGYEEEDEAADEEIKGMTKGELAAQIAGFVDVALEEAITPLLKALKRQDKMIKSLLADDATRMKQVMRDTPTASLSELMYAASAIGSKDTRVSRKSRLAGEKPLERKAKRGAEATGNNLVDRIFHFDEEDEVEDYEDDGDDE